MKRRDFFVKSSLVAGTTALTGLSASSSLNAQSSSGNKAAAKDTKNKFKLNYAPHFGMFENSAGKDLIDQLKFMADNGFMALEDNGLMGRPVEMQTKIGETLAKLGMTMGVFVVDKGGNSQNSLAAGKQEYIDILDRKSVV